MPWFVNKIKHCVVTNINLKTNGENKYYKGKHKLKISVYIIQYIQVLKE